MVVLAVLLVIIGVAGFGVAVAMLIARAVFKKGWEFKKTGITAGIALALFVAGTVTGIVATESSDKQELTAGRKAAVNQTVKSDDAKIAQEKPSSQPIQAQQKVEGNSDVPAAKEEQKPEEDTIPGIAAIDITGNLEKWGLKFDGPKPLSKDVGGGYHNNGEVIDRDTGAKLSCTISADNYPLGINSVTFRVDGTLMAGTLSPELYLTVAGGFLGYCATLPYDGAEPQEAKKWVEDNIAKANQQGKPLITTIGPVEYTLAGSKYFRLLTIKPIAK